MSFKDSFRNYLSYLSHRHRVLLRLIVVNISVSVAIWIIMLVGFIFGFPTNFIESYLSLPAIPGVLVNRWWTVITYMFTHYSPLHLLFNMLWLYWFAMLLSELSPRRLLSIYLGGGLAGAVLFIAGMNIFYAGSPFRLCGASASVMALLASVVVVAPNKKIGLMFFGNVQLKWLAIVAIIFALIGLGGGNVGGQFAHLGGMLFGVIYGFVVMRNRNASKTDYTTKPIGTVKREIRAPNPENTRQLVETIKGSANRPLADPERLDQLLDKIRVSGYGSLSYSERTELMAISSRLEADSRPPVQ